jgi:hypothetical protein
MILNMITNATRDATSGRRDDLFRPFRRECAPVHHAVGRHQEHGGESVERVHHDHGSKRVDHLPGARAGAPRTVQVATVVNVPYVALFNLVGTSLPVNRTVTFRDEVIAGGNGC